MGANAKAPKLSLNSGTIFCLYWYFFILLSSAEDVFLVQ